MVIAIVGANWGDEGKGKMSDILSQDAEVVVRFQGGANAGHTIVNEYGKTALHLLPSGIFRENVVNVIGQGVAFDISAFLKELEEVKAKGMKNPNIVISDRVQILMPYHIRLDELEEERLGKKNFGSTKSGIAPFYSDKYAKIGIQISEIYDDEYLKDRLSVVVMDYLATTAGGNDKFWFLQDGNRHELNFFWRVRPEFKQAEDFDTLVAKYRGYMRYSYGYSDYRGIVGSKGEVTPGKAKAK